MSQTIKLKRGTTTPTTSNIVSGEVAIDTSAQKLYINDSGTIKEIGGGLGSISVSDVPNLPASKITSGTFTAARIPSLDASKITSGTFGAARIPNLNASKITAGTIALARLPTIPYSQLSGTPTIPTSLPANGGNADTVDNLHAASFLRSDASDTHAHTLSFSKTGSGNFMVDPGGVKFGSVSSNVLAIRELSQLRFGDLSNWDWNKWAGIKFDATNNNLHIGGPASGAFTSNASPANISVQFSGTNSVISDSDFRAPIFYDQNDTAYYVHGDGSSNLKYANVSYLGLNAAPNTSGAYRLNMGGDIDMNNRAIHYASEIHFNDGPRFMDGDGTEGIILKSNSGSVSKLALQTSNGADRGYFYANSSNQVGILDSDHNWAIRHDRDSITRFYINNSEKGFINNDQLKHVSSVRAPIFYDSNNTNYYFHGDSESRMNTSLVQNYKQWAHGNPRNNLGDPTVTEMALFQEQFNNKTLNYATSSVQFYRQDTSSSSWVEDTSTSDTEIKQLLRGDTVTSNLQIPNGAYKFRIEVQSESYVYLNALYMYWSSESHSTKVHIWKRGATTGTWTQHTSSSTNVSSWPGHLYLPFSTIPFQTNGSSNKYDRIRIEFTPNWSGHATYGTRTIKLYKMQLWGGYPAGRRTPYYYDENLHYYFPANIQAYRYYDRDNTSKYLDPAGTSELSHLNVANNITAGGTLTVTGTTTLSNRIYSTGGSTTQGVIETDDTNQWWIKLQNYDLGIYWDTTNNHIDIRNTYGDLKYNNNKVWHAGNDGASSGLDADLLDGQHGSHYLNYNNLTNKPSIPSTSQFVDLTSTQTNISGFKGFSQNVGVGSQIQHLSDSNTYLQFDDDRIRLVAGGTTKFDTNNDYVTTNTAQTITGVKTFAADVNVSGNRSANFYAFNGAYLKATTDARAPIFYDHNDTTYYADPNGLSVLKDLRTGNDHHTNAPRWDTSFYVAQSQHWYGHSSSQVMFLGESANPVRLRGTLNIGSNADVNTSMRLTVRGHADATDSLRAPIFYDSDNTSYYVNPADGTTAAHLAGNIQVQSDKGLTTTGSWTRFTTAHGYIQLGPANTSHAHIYTNLSNFYMNKTLNINGGTQLNTGDVRSDIFYDKNNTGFYVNPAGTSELQHLDLNNGNLTGVNHITINDPGPTEGISWAGGNGWKIVESPDDLTTNSGGNLQFATGSTRRMTLSSGGDLTTPTGSVYTSRVYDRDDTGYYVDANSESVLNAVRGHHFRVSSGDGKGIRFWNSDSYKIYMSATSNSTHGGRVNNETTSDYNMYFRMTGGTNRGFVFRNNTNNVAGIDASGNFRAEGNVIAYAASDAKFKDDVQPIESALEKVCAIGGKTFTWNDKQTIHAPGKEDVGVIAQTVQEHVPSAVEERRNAEGDTYLGVDYERLVPVLLQAVSELTTELNSLKEKLK